MKSQKITKSDEATERRRYDDACGTAHALDLIGDRWVLLVVRELMFGGRRFGELRHGLPGLSANVLTQRLHSLEDAGIVQRRMLPPPANAQVYELTPWGHEAETAIKALGRWAARSPGHDPSLPLSAASLMLSFRTMLAPERLGDRTARVGFRIGDDRFVAVLADGDIAIGRSAPDDVECCFTGRATAIAAIVYGGRSFADAIADGSVTIDGSKAVARWFATLFPLPAKVVIA